MIYSCGNYRSASTGIRHTLSKICEENNLLLNIDYPHQKVTEITLNSDDIIVYSYRDVRNVITSFIKKVQDDVKGNKFGSYAELTILGETPIEFLHRYIETDNYVKNLAKDNPKNYIVLNYENDVMSKMGLLETLCLKLEIPCEDLNVGDSLITIDNFKNHPTWVNHISDGKSNFKDVLKLSEINMLESDTTIKNWLVGNNYKLHDNG